MNVNGGTGNAVQMEAFVEIELSRSLRFLIVAVNATDREELGQQRAYQEALHPFRVLRPVLCPPPSAGPRRGVSLSELRKLEKKVAAGPPGVG